MRQLNLLMREVLSATENENPTSGSGISKLNIVQYFNDAQNRLYSRIASRYPAIFEEQLLIDIVSGTEAYTLPSDIYLGGRIKYLEYLFSANSNDYCELPQSTLYNRTTHIDSNYPSFYILQNNTLLINPLPNINRTNGLRLTYKQSIRSLDVRRGIISDVGKTGTTLDTITLDITPALLKDADIVQAGEDVLNLVNYICVVDKDGVEVLNAIPIDSYDTITGIVTVTAGFTTALVKADLEDKYIVKGNFATTHCELDDSIEPYLLIYVEQKLLRRDANDIEAREMAQELRFFEQDILKRYSHRNNDLDDTPLDEIWQ